MCGVAGIISLEKDRPVKNIQHNQMEDMLVKIRHRGPDEFGKKANTDFIIGNVRLKIVGKDQGIQPISNGSSSLIFNGEIYNYKELVNEIKLPDISSDTLALFHMLNKSSMTVLPSLNGMFAFCYVTPEAIYLVRDRFGKKPLFYTIKNGMLYFASEMKAFLNIVDFTMEMSDTYMSLETEIASKTIFKDIYQVEAGSYLKINRRTKKITQINYYTPKPKIKYNRSEKQIVEELRHLVTDAVKIRSTKDNTLATYTSGGLDSSIISLLAKPDYMVSFDPNSSLVGDEGQFVSSLEEYLPETKSVRLTADNDSFLKDFITMVYINEGPTTTLGAYAQFIMSREAKKRGAKVVLSGIGADEFFNGYVRHAIVKVPSKHFTHSLFHSYRNLIDKSNASYFAASPANLYKTMLYRNNKQSRFVDLLLTKYFTDYKQSLAAISIADLHFTLPPLLRTDDYINMAFSLEGRSPFMDYRVVEFALGLSEQHKIHIDKTSNEVYTKHLLRKAFSDILPGPIAKRKDKVGLTSNVLDLLRGNMRYIFHASYNILKIAFPNHPFLSLADDQLGQYSRWEYQICQLAITYLLFTKQYSEEEVYEYYKKQIAIESPAAVL